MYDRNPGAKMRFSHLFLFFAVAFLWFSPTAQADSRVKVGSPAPPLTLKDLHGEHGFQRVFPLQQQVREQHKLLESPSKETSGVSDETWVLFRCE